MKDCTNYKDFIRDLLAGKDVGEDIYKQIELLPEGNHICHGDYHPGNIWVDEEGRLKIIDLMNICHGPKEYDIARTYFLITEGSMPAGISEEEKEKLTQIRKAVGIRYLEIMEVSVDQLQKYIEVITVYRRYEC